MIKIHELPTREQLINLAIFINDEFKNVRKDNMCVVFELNSDLHRQMDEELFYRNNPNNTEFTHGDEIELNILDVKFKFNRV